MTLQNGQKVIALDFDGVLHDYHGWNEGKLAGPIPGMQALVQRLIQEGAHVVIHTTRDEEAIRPWLTEHGFPLLPVFNSKWSRIDVFVDDRACEFKPDFVRGGPERETFARYLLSFQPYWRRPA